MHALQGRRLKAVLAGLATILAAAEAQALDCEALKTTRVPFAVDYRQTRDMKGGKGGTWINTRSQVFRRTSDETVTSEINGLGHVTHTRTRHDLFPLDVSLPGGGIRRWSYSIDTATDRKIDISADMTLAFTGNTSLEIEGCRFDLAKIVKTGTGTAASTPLRYTDEFWLSPELHTALMSRVETDDYTLTRTATTITLEFQRVDRNR